MLGAMARIAPARPAMQPTTTFLRRLFQIRLSCTRGEAGTTTTTTQIAQTSF
jgi:hypothetical protein